MKTFLDTLTAALTAVAIGVCAAVLMSATPAQAAAHMAGAAVDAAPQAKDDTLYKALGEKPGIAVVMEDFVGRAKSDARLQPFFKDINRKFLSGQLTDQICRIAGGPCVYDGASMKDAHNDLGVGKADFNALVEVLQDAMTAHDWPFSTQNRLLARLAPMHREIVTK